MTEEKNPVSRAADGFQRSVSEHILNALKAGLSTAPFCGGIASLMTDYIPSSKQQRLEQFATDVAADLDSLQKHVKNDVILRDDFAYIFEQCFRGAAEHYQQDKLDAFRGMLVNAATGFGASSDEREYFLNLVNSLSGLHLRILKFMAMPDRYLSECGISPDRIRGGFSTFLPVAIPGVNVEAIKSAFGELYQYGFINTDKSIFSTMTSGQGLDLLGQGTRVTQFGARFIQFCTSPK